jgi:hypothetical protein
VLSILPDAAINTAINTIRSIKSTFYQVLYTIAVLIILYSPYSLYSLYSLCYQVLYTLALAFGIRATHTCVFLITAQVKFGIPAASIIGAWKLLLAVLRFANSFLLSTMLTTDLLLSFGMFFQREIKTKQHLWKEFFDKFDHANNASATPTDITQGTGSHSDKAAAASAPANAADVFGVSKGGKSTATL